uniref:Uncharacterized protein n=1 Tax=Anguilla anguilla TaxID=7936 RepID=A0A0E9W1Y6_ANGAN
MDSIMGNIYFINTVHVCFDHVFLGKMQFPLRNSITLMVSSSRRSR